MSYYLLALTAKNCGGCAYFKANIQSQLIQALKVLPTVKYINYDASLLQKFNQDISTRDARIPSILLAQKINWVPNISLVLKKQLDNKSTKLELITYHGKLDNLNEVLVWVKKTIGVKSNGGPKNDRTKKTDSNDIILVKNGIEVSDKNEERNITSFSKSDREYEIIMFPDDSDSGSDDDMISRI